ncbi:MAG: tetraacyldisaccharide 4'-kinase [Moraxellaceae bacterium]|nr:tetraacyldisaccharide 4'-kinase [Moraxellaceae bacterium]
MARQAPAWWQSRGLVACLWLPLSVLFLTIATLRRLAYRAGIFRAWRLPVPVVVVGNLAVGGSGKTPVVIWLAQALRKRGLTPAILSRGYGGSAKVPTLVSADSDPAVVGDEPVLLARRAQCPVLVCPDRVAGGRALLKQHPDVDVLITDDGLQHYRLQRDVEIIVLDPATLGNRWPLPAGPMREPLSRMAAAQLLLWHGAEDIALETAAMLGRGVPRIAPMRLQAGDFYRLAAPSERRDAASLRGLRLRAVAGIGRPQRFFDTLRALGLEIAQADAFPDHHAYVAADLDLQGCDALLMTEKDAIKCAALAPPSTWVLPVEALIADAALVPVLERVHGSQTA